MSHIINQNDLKNITCKILIEISYYFSTSSNLSHRKIVFKNPPKTWSRFLLRKFTGSPDLSGHEILDIWLPRGQLWATVEGNINH